MKFCFPERDTDNIEGDGSEDSESSNGNSNPTKKSKFSNNKPKKGKETNFYVPIVKDDVEKMKASFFSEFAVQLSTFRLIIYYGLNDTLQLIGKSREEQTVYLYQNTRSSGQSELQR